MRLKKHEKTRLTQRRGNSIDLSLPLVTGRLWKRERNRVQPKRGPQEIPHRHSEIAYNKGMTKSGHQHMVLTQSRPWNAWNEMSWSFRLKTPLSRRAHPALGIENRW